jgi:hypothetical protein
VLGRKFFPNTIMPDSRMFTYCKLKVYFNFVFRGEGLKLVWNIFKIHKNLSSDDYKSG